MADDTKAYEEQLKKDQLAAAAEVLKTPVVIHGREGIGFSIDGPGLGSSGTLTIGGRVIPTTRWDDRAIRGILPHGVRGAISLHTQNGVRTGVFPTPPPPVVTTTTTVTKS
jgi:hypothetical protein